MRERMADSDMDGLGGASRHHSGGLRRLEDRGAAAGSGKQAGRQKEKAGILPAFPTHRPNWLDQKSIEIPKSATVAASTPAKVTGVVLPFGVKVVSSVL